MRLYHINGKFLLNSITKKHNINTWKIFRIQYPFYREKNPQGQIKRKHFLHNFHAQNLKSCCSYIPTLIVGIYCVAFF